MRFADPNWLWIGVLACSLTTLLALWDQRRRARALARFLAARHVLAATQQLSWRKRAVKHALGVLGVACAFFALARPQWGYHFEVERRHGIELMFAVDTSKSMLAEDVRPSRLERAKLAVQDLVRKLPDDPAGLVVFAGDAFLQTPLTLDRVAFRQGLQALASDLIPVPGTNLERAIDVAEQAFAHGGDQRKILILLSDGEDLEGSALDAARQAARHGLTIHTIGIGTPQGSPIPVRDEHGAVSLLHDASGAVVRSKLDESMLRQVAALSGGSYHVLGADGSGLAALYADSLAKLPAHAIETRTHKVFHERFQWPLSAAMALLLAAWLLRDDRRVRPQPRAAVAGALLAIVSFTGLGPSAHAQDQKPVDHYNQAAARYRAGQFADAAHDYETALASRDLSLQERAYYDRGNALYRVGQAASDTPQRIERYRDAVASYEAALALQPHDADAQYNRDFVKRKLEQLEQAQAQTKPQDQPHGGGASSEQKRSGSQQQAQANAGKQGAPQQPGGDQQAPNQGAPQQPGSSPQAGNQSAPQQPGGDQQARNQGAPRQPGGELKQRAADGGDANDRRSAAPRADDAAQADANGAEPRPDANAAADGTDNKTADARARPGALTRRESAQLLDALQGELRRLPSAYADNANDRPRPDRARKDW